MDFSRFVTGKNAHLEEVFLAFVVERDGSVVDVRVVRGIGSGCDEEAVRVLKSCPRWTPAYMFGMPVRIQYNVPIDFNLQPGGSSGK